jgi:hypothetical protein
MTEEPTAQPEAFDLSLWTNDSFPNKCEKALWVIKNIHTPENTLVREQFDWMVGTMEIEKMLKEQSERQAKRLRLLDLLHQVEPATAPEPLFLIQVGNRLVPFALPSRHDWNMGSTAGPP